MPRAISKGFKPISHSSIVEDTTSSGETWLYGYHLKVRHIRQIAQKLGLPWNEDPIVSTFGVQDHILFSCNSDIGWKSVYYRDRIARILTFIEDDERKRLELNKFTQEEMDNVRRVIGLPKGTKPKWFNNADIYEDTEFSSEDEAFPEVKDWGNRPLNCRSSGSNGNETEEDEASAGVSQSGENGMVEECEAGEDLDSSKGGK